MNKKRLKGLYAITDPEIMGNDLIAKTEQAILGGINILQYRNKTATHEQQMHEASTLATLCKKHHVLFLVNDNVPLAIKVNADGVHLGQKDTDIQQAREMLGENKIIGITCNNQVELAQVAQAQGADYIAFGRFFNSLTKPEAAQADLSLLSHARNLISIPIVAIGGITHETAPSLLNKGADMLAIIHGVFGQKDILNATQKLVKIINTTEASI